jgi:hypothetical protein
LSFSFSHPHILVVFGSGIDETMVSPYMIIKLGRTRGGRGLTKCGKAKVILGSEEEEGENKKNKKRRRR